MQKCTLTLITTADGKETREGHAAELLFDGSSAIFRYQDGDTSVVLTVSEGEAVVKRSGEYSMRLPLKAKFFTEGELSVGGSSGTLPIYTESVEFSKKVAGIRFRLNYQLIFEEERQEMCVSGYARINGEEL